MSLVQRIYAGRFSPLLANQRHFYAQAWTPAAIRNWQLARFNTEWQLICRNVPYFRDLQQQNDLPAQFASWQAFKATLPVMDRQTVQHEKERLANRSMLSCQWRSTGGSTAEPIQIPVWKSEAALAGSNMWYGRSWFGIRPADKAFLIWGHSHLLGHGIQGWLNGTKRRLKDAGLGYYRWSAYNLCSPCLQAAAEALLAFRPTYMMAYAVALDRFVRVNQHLRSAFHRLGLKVAIATAESFPHPDSAPFIADVLGCPVRMEYGAVETGPIAQQQPDGQFAVFWRHYFLEGYKSAYLPNAYELLVTSLFPRCLPLVRYKIGDLISEDPNHECFRQKFKAVIGRGNDLLMLRDGSVIHSEVFSHVLKAMTCMAGYQVVHSADDEIILRYVAARFLEAGEVAGLRRRLANIHPDLTGVRIERVASLKQTIAGKTRRIVRV